MTENKRFKRYLLDGGFWFDEYVKPVWSINDSQNKDNPIGFIEFKDEYKDLCDEVVSELNKLNDENEQLKQEKDYFEKKKCEYWNKFNLAYLDNINLQKENEQLKSDKQALIDFIKKEFPKSYKHILEGFE